MWQTTYFAEFSILLGLSPPYLSAYFSVKTGRAIAPIVRNISLLHLLRQAYATPEAPIVVSGCIGPRGDGYSATTATTVEEAERYHRPQIQAFAEAGADLAAAFTMNYVQEAIGISRSLSMG